MRDAPAMLTAILSAGLVLAPVVTAQQPDVRLTTFPSAPLIERDDRHQYLNFDFGLENRGADPVEIDRIDLSIYDRAGRLLRRQFIWAKGAASPGLRTVPERTVPPNGSLSVFNPFYTLPADLEIGRLRYDFVFGTEGIRPTASTPIDVVPVGYRGTPMTLPVDGPAIVYDGHDFYSHHRRIPLGGDLARRLGISGNPVRYANDLTPVGPAGELTRGSLAVPTDWYAYGAVVRAPAAGVVVSSLNDVPDNRIVNGELIVPPDTQRDRTRASLGNHVVIGHGPGEFSLLAHLEAGSVPVAAGDTVAQGEVVGRIGFSGDTGFHVHVHHSLSADFDFDTEGLPAYFDWVRRVALPLAPGDRPGPILMGARLDTGDIVQAIPTAARLGPGR